ncbi:MAG: YoaK family protein [Acetobacter sp.]|uniref:YoaK family protein n=1 Tax=Acetobacter sp. TaxID=440 RepID=UPI0039EC389A
MTTRKGHDARLVVAILLVTMAMGMLDAISLLHLKMFAGYLTASIILIAANIATSQAIVLSGFEAIGCFYLGALVGGRIVRRKRATRLVIGDILLGVGCLMGLTAWIWSCDLPGNTYITLGLLSLTMGLQTSATRHAQLPDMTLPAATVVLHGLAHNSTAAGGDNAGHWRRKAAIGALFLGALMGTLVSRQSVAEGIAGASIIVLAAGLLLHARPAALLTRLDRMSIT